MRREKAKAKAKAEEKEKDTTEMQHPSQRARLSGDSGTKV